MDGNSKAACQHLPEQAKPEVQLASKAYMKAQSSITDYLEGLARSYMTSGLAMLVCLLFAIGHFAGFETALWHSYIAAALFVASTFWDLRNFKRAKRAGSTKEKAKGVLMGFRLWPLFRKGKLVLRPYPTGEISAPLAIEADARCQEPETKEAIAALSAAYKAMWRAAQKVGRFKMIETAAFFFILVFASDFAHETPIMVTPLVFAAGAWVIGSIGQRIFDKGILTAREQAENAEDTLLARCLWPERTGVETFTLQFLPEGGFGPALDPFSDDGYEYCDRLGPRPYPPAE